MHLTLNVGFNSYLVSIDDDIIFRVKFDSKIDFILLTIKLKIA